MLQELLKRSFRPEFLNRLDEIVFYKPQNITEEQGRAIKEASERVDQLIRQESVWTDRINEYENRKIRKYKN